MRALPRSSTIGSVFVHPDIHREIARQRHQDLLADADRRRLTKKARRHGQRLAGAASQIEHVSTQREISIARGTAWMERGSKC